MTFHDVQKAANAFLRDHCKNAEIPINIELLVERQDFYIIPLPGLRNQVGTDACSRISANEIYVDKDYYENPKLDKRVRFTLAHELGHFILHGTEYQKIECAKIASVVEWAQRVRDSLMMNVRLESEADEFAGELLVPRHELAPMISDAILEAKQEVERRGWRFRSLDDEIVRKILGSIIGPKFDVSDKVVEIRISRHSLYPATKPTVHM